MLRGSTIATRMKSIAIAVAPPDIAFFKAAVESYDNLATLRTEDPARHILRMWFDPALEAEVMDLLRWLGETVALRILEP